MKIIVPRPEKNQFRIDKHFNEKVQTLMNFQRDASSHSNIVAQERKVKVDKHFLNCPPKSDLTSTSILLLTKKVFLKVRNIFDLIKSVIS